MEKVIITGVSGGLGFELAKLFLEKGFEVVGISRTKPDLEIKHIRTDLTKKEDTEKAIENIKKEFPDFQYIINCAGVLNIKPLDSLDFKEIENLFKVNVLAPMRLVSGLLDNIKENESDIVNVSSTVGLKAYEKQCAYGSSKWAVRGFTKNLQLELKNTKSRVIDFIPGGFKSRLFEKATGTKINLDSYMEPKELAKLLIQILELPKNMEVSEIAINRKYQTLSGEITHIIENNVNKPIFNIFITI